MVQLTNKLEKMHRSDLPLVVRQTLNDLAFDNKQNEIEDSFRSNFTIRKQNFIKSHTAANKSMNTFDISKMQSMSGVIKGKSTAGDMLEIQEFGGNIPDRENIPLPPSRTSKSNAKLVSKRNYLNRVKPKNKKPIKTGRSLIQAAKFHGPGSILLFDKVLIRVKNILKRGFVRYTKLYSVEDNRTVHISKSPFLEQSGMKTSKKIFDIYSRNAIKRLKKYEK